MNNWITSLVSDKVGQRMVAYGDQLLSSAKTVQTISDQLRSDPLLCRIGKLTDTGAEALSKLGHYLVSTELARLLDDAQTFSRQRPWLIGVGGFTLGIGASRVAKAWASRRTAPEVHHELHRAEYDEAPASSVTTKSSRIFEPTGNLLAPG